jgi:hypothetical protein
MDHATARDEAISKAFGMVASVLGFPILHMSRGAKVADALIFPLLFLNSALWAAAVVLCVQLWRRARPRQIQELEVKGGTPGGFDAR